MTDTPKAVRLADELAQLASEGAALIHLQSGAYICQKFAEAAALLRRIPELEADAAIHKARLFEALESEPTLKAAEQQVNDCLHRPTFMDMSKLLDVASANFTERKRVEAERDQLRAELEKVRVPDGWEIHEYDTWIYFKRPDGFYQAVTPNDPHQSHAQTLHMLMRTMLTSSPTPPHPTQIRKDSDEPNTQEARRIHGCL